MSVYNTGLSALLLSVASVAMVTGEEMSTPWEEYFSQLPAPQVALYNTVNWFLEYAVQTRTLDWLPARGITWELLVVTPEALQRQWPVLAEYAVGYVVIALVSGVTLVAMLVAACCVPLCRCACCCAGGTRKPREYRRDHERACYRGCCAGALLVTLGACVLGVCALSAMNGELFEQLSGKNSGFDQIVAGIEELPPFIRDTMRDVNTTVYAGAVETTDHVFAELDKLPEQAVRAVDEKAELTPTLNNLLYYSDKLDTWNTELQKAASLSEELETTTTSLAPELATSRVNILAAIETCGAMCDGIRYELYNLAIGLDADTINENVTTLSTTVSYAMDAGFEEQVELVVSEVVHGSAEITAQISSAVLGARADIDRGLHDKVLSEINSINNFFKQIDYTTVTDFLHEAKDIIIDTNTHWYAYSYFLFFTLIFVLIVVLLFVGLWYGCCSPRAPNTNTCCKVDRSSGSCWLFTGIFFIFCFYWLLTALTAAMFLGGGVAHTEMCRYFVHKDDDFRFRAAQETIVDFARNTCAHFDEDCIIAHLNVSVFEASEACRRNEPVYTALNMAQNGFDLRELLDLIYLREVMQSLVDSASPTIPEVDLLPSELSHQLGKLNDLFTTTRIDYLLSELGKNVTVPANLSLLADDLELIKNQPGITDDLDTEIAKLRVLYATSQQAEENKYDLNLILTKINQELGDYDVFRQLRWDLEDAQAVLNNEAELLIQRLIQQTVDTQIIVYDEFVYGAVHAMETEVGRCFPLFHGSATVINAGCVSFLYPINAMAFTLGWLMFFLLLALIFAFKLADHYRRLVVSRYATTNDDSQPLLPAQPSPRDYKYDLTQINSGDPQVHGVYPPGMGAVGGVGATPGGQEVYKVPLECVIPASYPPPDYSATVAGDKVLLIYPELSEAEPLPEKK